MDYYSIVRRRGGSIGWVFNVRPFQFISYFFIMYALGHYSLIRQFHWSNDRKFCAILKRLH